MNPWERSIVLGLIRARVARLLACSDYQQVMNQIVDLDCLLAEFERAEARARGENV